MNESFHEQKIHQSQADNVEGVGCDLSVGEQSTELVNEIQSSEICLNHHPLQTILSCTLPEKDFTINDSTIEVKSKSKNLDESNRLQRIGEVETSPLKAYEDQIAFQPHNESSPFLKEPVTSFKEPVPSETKTKTPLLSNWQQSWLRFGFKVEPKEEPMSSSSSSDVQDSLVFSQHTTKISTSFVKDDVAESIDVKVAKSETSALIPGADEKVDGQHCLELPLDNTNQQRRSSG